MLCKTKSYRQIIEPASKPIENLDNCLTLEGFRAWYEDGKKPKILMKLLLQGTLISDVEI